MMIEKKIGKLVSILRAKGYTPKVTMTDMPDIEDDSIQITDKVHVQVCSMSGEPVMCTKRVEDGFLQVSIDSVDMMLSKLEELIK